MVEKEGESREEGGMAAVEHLWLKREWVEAAVEW